MHSFRRRVGHAEIITSADPLDNIPNPSSCSRTGCDGAFCLSKLNAVKHTVLITIGHLVVLIASNFLAVRVASSSLGKLLGDPVVAALELQLALDYLERCVVRLVICRRLLLLKYKLGARLLGHVHLNAHFGSQFMVAVSMSAWVRSAIKQIS